jgi:hypothetical protein
MMACGGEKGGISATNKVVCFVSCKKEYLLCYDCSCVVSNRKGV